MQTQALGLLETFGLIPAIVAADTAVKSANVTLKELQFIGKGMVTVVIQGDISTVRAALDAAENAAGIIGTVHSATVIGRTGDGLLTLLTKAEPTPQVVSSDEESTLPDADALRLMKVVALRQFVRQLDGFPLDRKQINFAKKDVLIRLITTYKQKTSDI